MIVKKLTAEEWATLSAGANGAVFGWRSDPADERISFALLLLDPTTDRTIGWLTVQERDARTAYIQYGGHMPAYKGRGEAAQRFGEIVASIHNMGYSQVGFLVENVNVPMMRLALSAGFVPIGVRQFKKSTMIEFGREF